MRLKQCDFKEALAIIQNDFNLNLSNDTKEDFKIQLKESWNSSDLLYWLPYGISSSILTHYKVHPIQQYTRINAQKKHTSFISSKEKPLYGYAIAEKCYKIYSPLTKRFRFTWLGNKPDPYIFGYQQLPKSGNRVFITGGEKDVLSLYARNEFAVCFNSETATADATTIEDLKARFDTVIVLYDIDATGISQSNKLSSNFGLPRMELPQKLLSKGGKDIADFFKLGYTLQDPEVLLHPPTIPQNTQQIATNTSSKENNYMPLLLKTQKELTQRKAKLIHKVPPLLFQKDIGILYPRTINVIDLSV